MVSSPLTLSNPGTQASLTGTAITLALLGSNASGGGMAFSAADLPPGLSINASTGVISGTLASADQGFYDVTVTASSGAYSTSSTFEWLAVNTQASTCGNGASTGLSQAQTNALLRQLLGEDVGGGQTDLAGQLQELGGVFADPDVQRQLKGALNRKKNAGIDPGMSKFIDGDAIDPGFTKRVAGGSVAAWGSKTPLGAPMQFGAMQADPGTLRLQADGGIFRGLSPVKRMAISAWWSTLSNGQREVINDRMTEVSEKDPDLHAKQQQKILLEEFRKDTASPLPPPKTIDDWRKMRKEQQEIGRRLAFLDLVVPKFVPQNEADQQRLKEMTAERERLQTQYDALRGALAQRPDLAEQSRDDIIAAIKDRRQRQFEGASGHARNGVVEGRLRRREKLDFGLEMSGGYTGFAAVMHLIEASVGYNHWGDQLTPSQRVWMGVGAVVELGVPLAAELRGAGAAVRAEQRALAEVAAKTEARVAAEAAVRAATTPEARAAAQAALKVAREVETRAVAQAAAATLRRVAAQQALRGPGEKISRVDIKTAGLIDHMSGVDAFGGKIYTAEQMTALEAQIKKLSGGKIALVKNNALLEDSGAGAAFISPEGLKEIARSDPAFITKYGLQEYVNSGKGVFLVGDKATYNVVIHEVFHLEHWKSNPALYSTLSKVEKETHVLEQMLQPQVWNGLKPLEREAHINSLLEVLVNSSLSEAEKEQIMNTLIIPALQRVQP